MQTCKEHVLAHNVKHLSFTKFMLLGQQVVFNMLTKITELLVFHVKNHMNNCNKLFLF
jgi:hypothetical protein